MDSIPSEFPISLQSWPSKEKDPNTALPTLITRINIERGGFRDLSENGLRQEIAEAEAEAGDDASSDEEEERPDRLKELVTARGEMLQSLEQARQDAMYALDFISLLLSKDQPNLAGATISPLLRELVGMGTLGADQTADVKMSQDQKKENRDIAKGWKIQNLNKSVDSILASATRLEKEIEAETKYWEQVLAVSEQGWAICRLPHERHTLGVKFGFSEAAPAFKSRSLAALRREADGNISLDQGIESIEAQVIRVRIRNNNEETGSSPIPPPLPEDAPIQSRILEARNTIFSTELWQELNREARTLASFSVRAKEDTITCPLSSTKTMVLDLVPLGETLTPPRPDDKIASGIALALQILLSHQHRTNARRRAAPPPPLSAQKRQIPPYSLLRPLITRLDHQRAMSSIHALLRPLCGILTSAGLSPSYSLVPTPPVLPPFLSPTEAAVMSIIDRLETITTFKINDNVTITITSRTAMFPVVGTIYYLSLQPEECPLIQTCKAPPNLDSWKKVEDYVLFATGCALASSFSVSPLTYSTAPSPSPESTENGKVENEGWHSTIQPYILRKRLQGKSKQLAFQVYKTGKNEEMLRFSVRWEWIGDSTVLGQGDKVPGREGEGLYEWIADIGKWDDGKKEDSKSLRDVVEDAGKPEEFI